MTLRSKNIRHEYFTLLFILLFALLALLLLFLHTRPTGLVILSSPLLIFRLRWRMSP